MFLLLREMDPVVSTTSPRVLDGFQVDCQDAELSTVAVTCDEPTDAVDNSGRIGNLILRSLGQLGQKTLDRSLTGWRDPDLHAASQCCTSQSIGQCLRVQRPHCCRP